MEGMEDQRFSRLDGKDERLVIILIQGEVVKIGNTEGQLQWMEGQKY